MKIVLSLKLRCLPVLCLLYSSMPVADALSDEASFEVFCAKDSEKNVPLDAQGYVPIGGIEQWVTVKGSRCSNPVVLFAHGGPGNPMSLYADSVYKGWENEFTLVHWDQRGAGKTYEANQEIGELTVDRLNKTELSVDLIVRDGLEVADYIRRRLGKER